MIFYDDYGFPLKKERKASRSNIWEQPGSF